MKKLLILIVTLCLLTVTVYAAPDHMVDEADLLTASESAALEQQLTEISNRQGLDLVIVTVNSTGGASPTAYADDYYDYNGYRSDGILLLVSMEDRDWWVSTTGYGITAITDAGLDYISERFVSYLSDGDYAQAFREFAQLCDEFITQAKTGTPYDSYNLPKDPFDLGLYVLISLGIGLLAAWIVTGSMKADLRSVRQQTTADAYLKPGSLELSQSRDLYLYTVTDRRLRPQNNSSGSSTHSSSSGRSHGGGGGKF